MMTPPRVLSIAITRASCYEYSILKNRARARTDAMKDVDVTSSLPSKESVNASQTNESCHITL